MASEITEYERLRNKNIQTNSQKLSDLGLLQLAVQLAELGQTSHSVSLKKRRTLKQPRRGQSSGTSNPENQRQTRAKRGRTTSTRDTNDDINGSDEEIKEDASKKEWLKVKELDLQRNQPRPWSNEGSRKNKMTSTGKAKVSTHTEEENTLSQYTDDTEMQEEFEEDSEDHFNAEEDEDGPSEEPYTNVVDELELREVGILKRMAKTGANPKQLREKMRKLGQMVGKEGSSFDSSPSHHRQSKLKQSSSKVPEVDQRDWVEVDQAGHPKGVHRAEWLTKLRGYSRDLDWSIDNFKCHPPTVLSAIKSKMASKFEYRGGLGDVPDTVFFQILRQQMRTRRSNMKRLIEAGAPLPKYIKAQHVQNFKDLIKRTDKIAYSQRMKVARHALQNEPYHGRSEADVRSHLAAHLGRPPTESEVQVEIAIPEKCKDKQSSNLMRGNRGLEEVRQEFYTFKDSVKEKLSDMSDLVKELLLEVRKQNEGKTHASSSQVGTTGPEEGVGEEMIEEFLISRNPEPVKAQKEAVANLSALNTSAVMVVDAIIEEEEASKKLETIKRKGKTLVVEETSPEEISAMNKRKDQESAKKRKGEAEKLLVDQNIESIHIAAEEGKVYEKIKKVKGDPKEGSQGSREVHRELDLEVTKEEPARRRGAMRAAKGGKPSMKKKPSGSLRFPPITVSDDSRRKILVLNVKGFLCDIRPLPNNEEWGPNVIVRNSKDFEVKILKRGGCAAFLSMLHSRFDVGIWAPIGEALLQEVAKFLAIGSSIEWCFLWGKEIGGSIRNLHDLFDMIPDPTHGPARVLQVDYDSTATSKSPSLNVLHIVQWDPMAPNDTYFKNLVGPFEAMSRNPSDIEYCVKALDKAINGASKAKPSIAEGGRKLVEGPMTVGSKVKVFEVDSDKKAEENVLAHGVIVSLAGGTLHGRLIEEGNVSITISSVVPGAERILLYEGNNNDDPPVVCLGDAVKSITKWPIEALASANE